MRVALGMALVAALGAGALVVRQLVVRERTQGERAPAAGDAAAVARERDRLDATVWAPEIEAERHEETFVRLWDDLRAAADPFAVLAALPLDSLRLPLAGSSDDLEDGIHRTRWTRGGRVLVAAGWAAWLAQLRDHGYRLVESEWNHESYHPAAGAPARSTFAALLHVEHPLSRRRIQIDATFEVTWSGREDARGLEAPGAIEITEAVALERAGSPWFVPAAGWELPETGQGHVIVNDLDGDGRPDILLPAVNVLLRNGKDGRFTREPLFLHATRGIWGGVAADFTGDGAVDFAGGGGQISPLLYRGSAEGRFAELPSDLLAVPLELVNARTFTAGDIDLDGDLDLWIGQYKPPYVRGQMPTPYYDANDGFPSYLLVNQGSGRFADETESRGLASKRQRRTYSASFADLDDDADLDLVVVSDFAGLDVWKNDGSGHFSDVTATAVDEPRNFGMAHTFADYDRDGRIDLCVIGMSSAAARRLDRLGLYREGFPEHNRMRAVFGYGNRLYLGREAGRFTAPPGADAVARSGWSWGCASSDFDLDGDVDLFVANGNVSGRSARDYCPRFWCHDVYISGSETNRDFGRYFRGVMATFGREISWDGYQHDRLFVNRGGADFANVGYLAGVAFETDTRATVAADMDLDGREDLLVGELLDGWDPARTRSPLHLLLNRTPPRSRWIGVRLRETPGVTSQGAVVTVRTDRGVLVAPFVSGDSFISQHPLARSFGLGEASRVESIEVRWPGGKSATLVRPGLDRYHEMPPR